MTVAFYITTFTAVDGKKVHGEILWDKHHPRQLRAYIAPYLEGNLVDYSIWEIHGGTSRPALDILKAKLKTKAKKLGLTFVDERETEYAPKDN